MNRCLTSKKLRAALWIAADGKCQMCGIDLPDDWHADHVIPWSKTAITNVHDMQALCPKCNLRKGDQTVELRKLQRDLKELLEDRLGIARCRQTVINGWPGSGKSMLPVIAASVLKKRGLIDKVIVIVPRLSLKRQGALAFEDKTFRALLNHDISIREAEGGEVNPCKGTGGFTTTYQAVQQNSQLIENYCKKHRVLLVLDEVHHVGDGSPTHKSLREIYNLAHFRLLMTGTLDRNEGDKIAFLGYSKPDVSGLLLPDVDIYYGLRDGLKEKAIIPTHFYSVDGRISYIDRQGQHVELPLLSQAGDDTRDGLAAALKTEFAYELLDKCVASWQSWKKRNLRSKLLVVCKDINQANEMAQWFESKDISCGIATSEDSSAALATIKAFRDGDSIQVLVTVAMAYEGLDVRSITHIACLTYYRSKSWLIQMFNRATRFDPEAGPWRDQRAFIFVPKDSLMEEAIQFMRDEGIDGVDDDLLIDSNGLVQWENIKEKQDAGGIIPLDGRVEAITAQSIDEDEVHLEDGQLRYLENLKESANVSAPAIDIAKILIALGHPIGSISNDRAGAPLSALTPKDKEDALRESIQSKCSFLDKCNNEKPGTWNTHVLKTFKKSRQDMSVPELKSVWAWLNKAALEANL